MFGLAVDVGGADDDSGIVDGVGSAGLSRRKRSEIGARGAESHKCMARAGAAIRGSDGCAFVIQAIQAAIASTEAGDDADAFAMTDERLRGGKAIHGIAAGVHPPRNIAMTVYRVSDRVGVSAHIVEHSDATVLPQGGVDRTRRFSPIRHGAVAIQGDGNVVGDRGQFSQIVDGVAGPSRWDA